MRFGSVCSGIEAASVAWGPLGWSASWFAEIDVAASALLAHHYGATAPQNMPDPNEPLLSEKEVKFRQTAMKRIAREQWGDRVVNFGDFSALIDAVRVGVAEAPDVLCGGTPCQAYSLAGRREGLADPRGQLTLKFVELADAIDQKRRQRGEAPCVVFWENVPGVLTSKDNAFGCFLADLAGEDVPLEPPGERWTNCGVVLGPKRAIAWRVLDAQYFGLAQRRKRVFVVASSREGFDPASVLLEFDGLRRDSAPCRQAGEDVAGTLVARPDGGGFPGTDDACSGYVQPVTIMAHGQGGAEISQSFCPTLTCNHEAPIVSSGFSANDFGADVGHEVAPTMRAMNNRNSHSNSGGHIAACITGQITHTLTAEGHDASEDGSGRGQPIVAEKHVVRRLMPVECERLQGFPDNYTQFISGAKAVADSPRYKQLGNSWAVPCVHWIGARIDQQMRSARSPSVWESILMCAIRRAA